MQRVRDDFHIVVLMMEQPSWIFQPAHKEIHMKRTLLEGPYAHSPRKVTAQTPAAADAKASPDAGNTDK